MGALLIPISFVVLIVYALIKRVKAKSELKNTLNQFNLTCRSIDNINATDTSYILGSGHIYE